MMKPACNLTMMTIVRMVGDEAGMEFENGGNNLSQFVDFIALLGHIYVTLILLQ